MRARYSACVGAGGEGNPALACWATVPGRRADVGGWVGVGLCAEQMLAGPARAEGAWARQPEWDRARMPWLCRPLAARGPRRRADRGRGSLHLPPRSRGEHGRTAEGRGPASLSSGLRTVRAGGGRDSRLPLSCTRVGRAARGGVWAGPPERGFCVRLATPGEIKARARGADAA
eukprot:scaffold293846_cov24-Tisochrysis_lutea.AAC.1